MRGAVALACGEWCGIDERRDPAACAAGSIRVDLIRAE
ncbi:hypothetical protein BURPS305_5601 [Burkholderia pseudomallei 305]|nr:hypothetical protein BURPS305_5601 [Burkholderia pseudomallei 305]